MVCEGELAERRTEREIWAAGSGTRRGSRLFRGPVGCGLRCLQGSVPEVAAWCLLVPSPLQAVGRAGGHFASAPCVQLKWASVSVPLPFCVTVCK